MINNVSLGLRGRAVFHCLNSAGIGRDYFFRKDETRGLRYLPIQNPYFSVEREAISDKEFIIRLPDILHVLYHSGSRSKYRK